MQLSVFHNVPLFSADFFLCLNFMRFFVSIAKWPLAERPREKLLTKSAGSLSDAELLALLFRTGAAGKTAVDLARELLQANGGLAGVFAVDLSSFLQIKGLGRAKYVQIQAARELGARLLKSKIEHNLLGDVTATKSYLLSQFGHRRREVFAVLCLDSKLHLIENIELFEGSVNRTVVHPGELVKAVLARHAAGVVLVHNHPSGDSRPSQADVRLTERLKAALALVDIKLFDHMVVGRDSVYSMVENGDMISCN
jgi:DNA repair protein RadC